MEREYELYHYGVKGMRWGVRRAQKQLAKATTREDRDKAIAVLKKHREKGSAKVEALQKKSQKLEKHVERAILKNDPKAARLASKAASYRNAAYSRFASQAKVEKRLFQANKLQAKANALKAASEKAKTELASNKALIETFNTELRNIDAALVNAGKRKLKM